MNETGVAAWSVALERRNFKKATYLLEEELKLRNKLRNQEASL